MIHAQHFHYNTSVQAESLMEPTLGGGPAAGARRHNVAAHEAGQLGLQQTPAQMKCPTRSDATHSRLPASFRRHARTPQCGIRIGYKTSRMAHHTRWFWIPHKCVVIQAFIQAQEGSDLHIAAHTFQPPDHTTPCMRRAAGRRLAHPLSHSDTQSQAVVASSLTICAVAAPGRRQSGTQRYTPARYQHTALCCTARAPAARWTARQT